MLIAAGEITDRVLDVGIINMEFLAQQPGRLRLGVQIQAGPGIGMSGQGRQGDVLADRHGQDQALGLAIFGRQANAERQGLARRGQRGQTAVDQHGARRGPIGATEHAQELGAASAHEAGNP